MTKKQKNIKKKKIIVIAAFMVLLLIVTAVLSATIFSKPGNENITKTIDNVIYNISNSKHEDKNEIKSGNENENISNETQENNTTEQPVQNNETKKEETTSVATNTENNTVKNKSDLPYYIKVNYQANVVTIYKKDNSGEYKPFKAMLCSCGDYTPPCDKYPDKIYQIPTVKNTKFAWAQMQGGVFAQYATRIVKNILFHSVPYTKGWNTDAKGSLEWEEYDKLGTKASLGCIRLTVADAKWIYDNIAGGTTVEFYADSNPGPLGKPTARKISGDTEVRGWDPTDPDKKNPWPEYLKKKADTEKQQEEDKLAKEASAAASENTTNTTKSNDNTNTTNNVSSNTTNANTNTKAVNKI